MPRVQDVLLGEEVSTFGEKYQTKTVHFQLSPSLKDYLCQLLRKRLVFPEHYAQKRFRVGKDAHLDTYEQWKFYPNLFHEVLQHLCLAKR